MPSRAPGARLNSAQPSDIEFLSDFLTNLSALLPGEWTGVLPVSWRGLITVQLVLSEILGEGYNTRQEPHTSQYWELDSDTEDETWVEEWEVQELLAWMLLEARTADLPEESHHLVEWLEQRLTATSSAPSESSSANVTFPGAAAETDLLREPEEYNQPSLIPSLPTELLYAIFESVCSPRSLALFSPLILSHVDSHFRSIALGMPSLWSTIDDIIPLEIAKLYLERSESVSLDIRIGSESGATVEQDISRLNEFFHYLEPHAHRVKALKVMAMNFNIILHLERLVDYKFPFGGLERLEYGHCFSLYRGESDYPLSLHEPSSLRELHLWSCPLDRWIDGFPAALRRLQLTAVAVSFDVLMAALESSPGLSALVLDDCNLLGNGKKFVDAGSLIKLQFTRIDSEQMVRFAGLIRTPALAALSVVAKSDTSTDGSTNHDFLVNLVRGSKEILFIEICDYDFTESEWLSIFEHLPGLAHLRVRASYSSDDDLRALTTADILPNLTSITLDNELRLTARLVQQMARTHPKLESIALRGWDPSNVSPESITAISELVKTLLIETFRASVEEECDEETESNSSDDSSTEGSWV